MNCEKRRPGSGSSVRYPDMRTITIVLVDESVLMHIALRALLRRDSRYSVVAAACTVPEAEQAVRQARPGLLICDAEIGGESGIDLCRRVRRVSGGTRVVILTARKDPLLARLALAAGAAAYLLKDAAPAALTASLDEVLHGTVVTDARLGTVRDTPWPPDPLEYAGFSRREREVLAEMVSGLDNRAIAGRLCVSEETVKSHVKAVFRKLGARDRAHAVAIALGAAAPDGSPASRECLPAPVTLVPGLHALDGR